MLHQTDEACGGCDFDRFFHITPPDLVKGGLYRQIAIAWHPGRHRQVSRALAAEALGAERCLATSSQTAVTKYILNPWFVGRRKGSTDFSVGNKNAWRKKSIRAALQAAMLKGKVLPMSAEDDVEAPSAPSIATVASQ